MFRYNLKIAWRNILKDRLFSLLNLVGLSTGMACAILIYLWVRDERSVDKFHRQDKHLFRVMENTVTSDGIQTNEGAPGLLSKALIAEMPEVKDAVTAALSVPGGNGINGILSFGDNHIKARDEYVTKNFFSVFSYQLVQGNKDQVLSDKYSVVLSEDLAMKLFHTTDNIIGKMVDWNRAKLSGQYVVSGIFKAPPSTSTDKFDLLFSYDIFFDTFTDALQKWGNSTTNVYVLLKDGVSINQFNDKIRDFVKSKFNASGGDPASLKYIPTLFLQRYSDKYLYNKFENGVSTGGRIAYVKLFSIIALFILVIACINFMNLSTAKASRRTKEVGIKKVVGVRRGSLIVQYLGESLLMSFLSLILAILLVILFRPLFNEITGKHMPLPIDLNLILAAIGITLFTGLISGSYPALYLSGFHPATVLKGTLKNSVGELLARKGLVIFQFSISIILIVSVLVVYKQMGYIQTVNLGYNKDNIIHFDREGRIKDSTITFLTEIKQIPGVINASSMGYDVSHPDGTTGGLRWDGKDPEAHIEFADLEVGYDLIEMLGYQLKEGRSFSRNFGTEDSKMIMNEAAIESMGLKNPIGKTVGLWGKNYEIIGVVKDFHIESLYEKVKPCFFRYIPVNSSLVVKIKAGMVKETLARLEKFYTQYNLGLPFEYKFMDADYQAMYASEQQVALLSRFFAGLAIIISCLGLFGLAAFTAHRRRKEIGIRKVMGAGAGNVVMLLSKDFLKLILIAILIAFPLAWWTMRAWLQAFVYRVDLGAGLFLVAGALIMLITVLTISFQAVKAGIANPTTSLRSEG